MIELLQFRHSHYNEKVRWALDVKRVPHRRRSLLPGPHVPIVRRASGQTSTPVLIVGDGSAIFGSARILEWLEGKFPEPALLPAEPAGRREALAVQRWFDEDIMPRIRRPALDALLRTPTYFADVFGDGRGWLARRAYAFTVPGVASLVRKANGISGPDAIADGLAATKEALDFIVERSAATGYLAGSAFTLADLTAAAALSPLIAPEDSPMAAPLPVAAPFAELMARFAAHEGVAWVRTIYARHRGARSDFDGVSAPSSPARSG